MPRLKLEAQLGLNKTGFDAGIKAAGKQIDRFASGIVSSLAGAFSIYAFGGFLKSVTEATNRVKDLSEQYRITTDEVQETDFALQQSGMQFEDLGQSINKLAQARRAAVEGNMELRKTFERYGISLKDLNNPQFRTYDLLLKLSGALKNVNITAREQVELADLLGTKAGRLINVLNDLAQIKPPSLFSKDDILAIDRAEKALKALRLQGQVVAAKPTAMTADVVTTALKGFQGFVSGFAGGTGFKGRMQGAMAGMDKGMMEGILGTTFKPVMDAVKDAAQGGMNALLGTIFPKGKEPELFKVDKDVKEKTEKARRFHIEESPLGRIGAFSGGGASQNSSSMQGLQSLRRIESALIQKGIIVRDVK